MNASQIEMDLLMQAGETVSIVAHKAIDFMTHGEGQLQNS
jgi:hypothetical protein